MLATTGSSAAAENACEAGTHAHAAKRHGHHGQAPLVVGDSTLILAAPKLGALGLEADARGCRQFTAGVALLRQRRDAGTLPRVVVLALGANGPISDSAMGAALKAVGRNRVLALVTARRSPASDRQMYAAAHRHRNRVLLIDWVAHSAQHPSWFAGDGLHVGDDGARAYAHFIRHRLRPFLDQPVRALHVARHRAAAESRCRAIHEGGGAVGVYVVRGAISCALAQRLVRRPIMRRISGWSYYDWRPTHDGPWSRVYVRRGGHTVVAATTDGRP